jgi:hypothetical protein
MPPAETPLNQHSLQALELWLQQLGAQRLEDDPCGWLWKEQGWMADTSATNGSRGDLEPKRSASPLRVSLRTVSSRCRGGPAARSLKGRALPGERNSSDRAAHR